MIFATVGTQLAFPRLIAALDALAPGLDEEIRAQIGEDDGRYPNLTASRTLTPSDYENAVSQARLLVAHAGIGTILTARRLQKPLIIMPRKYALGEHRNDHQIATANHVKSLKGIHVAENETQISKLINQNLEYAGEDRGETYDQLVDTLKLFIAN